MIPDNVFVALDLAGTVRGVALCEEAPGISLDSPGWLVRSHIRRLHWWIGSVDSCPEVDQASRRAGPSGSGTLRRDESPGRGTTGPGAGRLTVQQVLSAGDQWQIPPPSMRLVPLSHESRADAFELAEALGIPWLCVPQSPHVISPRGIAPAVAVKDYAHPITPPAQLDLRVLREAFVSLMERAADDVQKDGLEQDDAFLDRYAEIRAHGESDSLIVPVETLTDPAWLLNAWCQYYAEWRGHALDPARIELVNLRLRCVVGAPDHGFRPGAAPRNPPPIVVPELWQCETTRLGHVLCQRKRGND